MELYKGYEIKIVVDEFSDDPRNDDNLGIMACYHKRHDLGDKKEMDAADLQDALKSKDIISLPIYMYEHSGIALSTKLVYPFNDPWDAGEIGVIYATKDRIRKHFGVKRISKKLLNQIPVYLDAEVETYNNYVSGNVYGYDIEGVDSCYGFYGDPEKSGLIDDAKAAIDRAIAKIKADHAKALKSQIKAKVGLAYRTPLAVTV
jgi:hypothetical protein